jgi:hypothetical protein
VAAVGLGKEDVSNTVPIDIIDDSRENIRVGTCKFFGIGYHEHLPWGSGQAYAAAEGDSLACENKRNTCTRKTTWWWLPPAQLELLTDDDKEGGSRGLLRAAL